MKRPFDSGLSFEHTQHALEALDMGKTPQTRIWRPKMTRRRGPQLGCRMIATGKAELAQHTGCVTWFLCLGIRHSGRAP